MTTTTLIGPPPQRAPAQSSPQADMAAHIVVVTAMTLAMARIVAVNSEPEQLENFLAGFQAQCDKLAAQYGPAVVALAQKTCGEMTAQLRDAHRGHR
jgi:hypothetical protein